jgi:hypothetical protein
MPPPLAGGEDADCSSRERAALAEWGSETKARVATPARRRRVVVVVAVSYTHLTLPTKLL